MTTIELIVSFVLGYITMLCAMWIAGVKKKAAALVCINSLSAPILLIILTSCFNTALKLNAFSLYISTLLGFGGVGLVWLINAIL